MTTSPLVTGQRRPRRQHCYRARIPLSRCALLCPDHGGLTRNVPVGGLTRQSAAAGTGRILRRVTQHAAPCHELRSSDQFADCQEPRGGLTEALGGPAQSWSRSDTPRPLTQRAVLLVELTVVTSLALFGTHASAVGLVRRVGGMGAVPAPDTRRSAAASPLPSCVRDLSRPRRSDLRTKSPSPGSRATGDMPAEPGQGLEGHPIGAIPSHTLPNHNEK